MNIRFAIQWNRSIVTVSAQRCVKGEDESWQKLLAAPHHARKRRL